MVAKFLEASESRRMRCYQLLAARVHGIALPFGRGVCLTASACKPERACVATYLVVEAGSRHSTLFWRQQFKKEKSKEGPARDEDTGGMCLAACGSKSAIAVWCGVELDIITAPHGP